MDSINFEALKPFYPDLAELGGLAERYAYSDAPSALTKLRLFAERMVEAYYLCFRLPKPDSDQLLNLLEDEAFKDAVPKVVRDKLHLVRIWGNKAVHQHSGKPAKALELLRECYDLGRWFYITLGHGALSDWANYQEPDLPEAHSVKAIKAIQKPLAPKEAKLKEWSQQRQATAASKLKAGELQAALARIKDRGKQPLSALAFDEATTRKRLIDVRLREAGWDVSETEQVGQEVTISYQLTASGKGIADYVLWGDDGKPLAVVEAKRNAVDAQDGKNQAAAYADGLEKQYAQRPLIYYTNGDVVNLWDDAQGYPPRQVRGFYTKESLLFLIHQRTTKKQLDQQPIREDIVDRHYQIEAVKQVCERFASKHRQALIVQATGTGKTRVAVALTDRLLRAGWVQRMLFLVDRVELLRQAEDAFTEYIPNEPLTVVDNNTAKDRTHRLYIATQQTMVKLIEKFDVGFFDLIFVDESHRSIYKHYGQILHYFDTLQVGLTATPVDFIDRNTYKRFDCKNGQPTAFYSLDKAVSEKYLVKPKVYAYTTEFLRKGIKYNNLEDDQKQELEDELEDTKIHAKSFNLDPQDIDKEVFSKGTNHLILRNLMEAGIKDGTGHNVGKTIVFARNIKHANLLVKLFNELFPNKYGGKFCQAIHSRDPYRQQLIDEFKSNKTLTIAISVGMLDTGIDIREIVNLVFARPVFTPTQFWQMLGRGTRLCHNLFGPGKHKDHFLVFDHWGNFDRFDLPYDQAEPSEQISLLERLFKSRLELARLAFDIQDMATFDHISSLIQEDIQSLPQDNIYVKDKLLKLRQVANVEVLKRWDKKTCEMLKDEVNPLMRWRDLSEHQTAYQFDVFVTELQIEKLHNSARYHVLQGALIGQVKSLNTQLNQVKAQLEWIELVQSGEFWEDATIADLEAMRLALRGIMQYHSSDATAWDDLLSLVIDVKEDASLVEKQRIYPDFTPEGKIKEVLTPLFTIDPVLKKLREAQPLSEQDLHQLVSLVLTQRSQTERKVLEEFFPRDTPALFELFREIVGLDEQAVEKRFSKFESQHLNAKQTQYLQLLKKQIAIGITFEVEKLYEHPFNQIGEGNPDSLFDEKQMKELGYIIKSLKPTLEETATQ